MSDSRIMVRRFRGVEGEDGSLMSNEAVSDPAPYTLTELHKLLASLSDTVPSLQVLEDTVNSLDRNVMVMQVRTAGATNDDYQVWLTPHDAVQLESVVEGELPATSAVGFLSTPPEDIKKAH